MTHLMIQVLLGSTALLVFAPAPALAQHSGHGSNQDDSQHGDKAASPIGLAKCPVMNESINLAVNVETADGPVYFCCQDCIPKYQASPAKYAAKIAAQRKILADRPKIQVLCPVSKDPVDQDISVESAGKTVYFCCKGCINKYKADPARYASALANSYTYQTKCPVMGEHIDPKAFTTAADGKRIFFCCDGCNKKFYGDLEKYTPNLIAQGFSVKTKEMVSGADKRGAEGHDGLGHDHP